MSASDALAGLVGVQHCPHASWSHRRDAWLIQIGTRSRFNHAGVAVRTRDDGAVEVIEAAGGGVRRRWVDPADKTWLFVNPGLNQLQRTVMVREAERNLGLAYDYGDIARFVLRFWTNKIPRRARPDYADDRVICSELVAWCLHVAGVDPWPDRAFGAVSPGDIADWLLRHLAAEVARAAT